MADDRFEPLTATFDGLVLRPFVAADAPLVAEGCNDPQTQRWVPLPYPYTMDHAIDWTTVASHALREDGDGLHQGLFTVDGQFIGAMSLVRTNWRYLSTEIGYWATPAARGHGHITTATIFLSRWALDNGMGRVELCAEPENTASRRVAEKAGFTFEGVKRSAGVNADRRVDLCLYSLIRSDLDQSE
ncbi:GNAT family N-acetyltransferase [Stackebrandtia soli]|uniref:GNAT family N-acetyltransferase n=1 Tax=Stackebrandtia soli TaxID=1892856 RepID=UPI0039EA8253